MSSFFADLRKAREAKQISLSEISDATLINIRFLEALEKGDTSILPQAYVRAFLREYAAFIGLNPDEILRKYDEERTPAAEKPRATEPAPSPPPHATDTPSPARPSTGSFSPKAARLAFGVLMGIVLMIIVWNLLRQETPPQTTEVPFEDVVQEHEGTIPDAVRAAQLVQEPDTLTLKAVTSDTVWVELIIDAAEPRQYLFKPNTTIVWKAQKRFAVTAGNAGAIRFTLNTRELGPLGKPGQVVRNVEFSHKTLNPLERPAP